MKKMLITVATAACAAFELAAMPTETEVARAKPSVQKLLAPEQVALKDGKMTRAEVAAAAMKFAGEADTDAAKLLLMKGAFVLYVRDGNLEKAVETMNTLEAAIPDLPPRSVTNMVETALQGADKNVDSARLRQLLAERESSTSREMVNGYSWSYRVANGEAMIIAGEGAKCFCAVSPSPKGSITIPSTLGGVRVTCVGTNAFVGCKQLNSVSIPEGVTSICPFSFAWCDKLRSVAIPESMKSIATGAFQGCSGLTSMKIPSGVTNIGPAFFHCSGLTAIRVDSGNKFYKSVNGLLLTKDGKTLVRGVKGDVVIPAGVTDIANGAFFDCGLKSVEIPSSVSNIWQTAFCQCGELTSLTIPEGVTHLGLTAFKDCVGLTSMTIPSTVRYVGNEVFLDCKKLTSVTMCGEKPESGKDVFKNCGKLKVILVPANAKSWAGMKEWQGIPLVFDAKAESGTKPCRLLGRTSETENSSTKIRQRFVKPAERLAQAAAKDEGVVGPITKDDFKARLTGIAIIQGGKMCGFESRAKTAEFMSPDSQIEIPYGKAACFRIEYDFPEGYQARVWTRDRWPQGQGKSWYFGSNPSPLYKGKGVAYGFLDMLERGKTCTLEQLAIQTNAEPKLEELPKGWSIATFPVHIKFHGPEEVEAGKESEKCGANGSCAVVADTSSDGCATVVAQKLQACDFLLNSDFKKNAKYYLCLFSASWCGPCRAEMPRIAKIYAETLKADPDIELIHFSRDRDDEKAMAWAKEHNVKFPVVKPKGGNPLDLKMRGIPRLFIIKADGTLVEEGHPANLFSAEILKELETGAPVGTANRKVAKGEKTAIVDGYTWSFRVKDGVATIVAETDGRYSCAVSPSPKGHLVIPSTLGGVRVGAIGRSAFQGCKELTTVTIPAGVRSIGYESFQDCSALQSVTIPEGVRYIGNEAFENCSSLTSVTIPSSVSNIEILAFFRCTGLGEGVVIRDGWVLTVNGRCPADYVIPQGTRGIASHAFRCCEGLKSVTVPSSVKHMGYWAFSYCRDLRSITMLGECPEMRINVFSPGQNIEEIHVPANAKSWAGMKEWQGVPLVFD